MSSKIVSNFCKFVDELQTILANQKKADDKIDRVLSRKFLSSSEVDLVYLRLLDISEKIKININHLELVIDNICLTDEVNSYQPLQRDRYRD